ncbi:GFA family protein [Thalassotalea ganghwensis]
MKGSCLCGEIRFEITEPISALYQCHCTLCQKQSGTTSNTATIVTETGFIWLSEEHAISHWQKTSGFTAHFCQHCGCPVPNQLRGLPYFWVPMGLIDNPIDISIKLHLCCNSKAPWDALSKDVGRQYAEMPATLEQFIEALNS